MYPRGDMWFRRGVAAQLIWEVVVKPYKKETIIKLFNLIKGFSHFSFSFVYILYHIFSKKSNF